MRNHFGCRWTPEGTGKYAQHFCLPLARQQAWEGCEKRLFKIFERCATFLSVAGQAAGPGKLRKTTF
ncbi:hypothetical protein T11_9739 [Trichinella zimbabwensis]|uniref:Uncharacterized protein n=1 Tax=Trichinella zimbabwensis TaxID=268475 RepID=A0A0V1G8E3_9BILA|nr:hypothetical protein T11_9739 [Trichinella zimbabwensis]